MQTSIRVIVTATMTTVSTTIRRCTCRAAVRATLTAHVARATGIATAEPAATTTAAAAATSTSATTSSARRWSFAFGYSFLHVNALANDHVRLVEDHLVYGVRVGERDEAEAARAAS